MLGGLGRVGRAGKGGNEGEIGGDEVKLGEMGRNLLKFVEFVEINQEEREMSFNCDKRACTLSVWRMCAVVKTKFEACVV